MFDIHLLGQYLQYVTLIGVRVERLREHQKWNAQTIAKVGHKGARFLVGGVRRGTRWRRW